MLGSGRVAGRTNSKYAYNAYEHPDYNDTEEDRQDLDQSADDFSDGGSEDYHNDIAQQW